MTYSRILHIPLYSSKEEVSSILTPGGLEQSDTMHVYVAFSIGVPRLECRVVSKDKLCAKATIEKAYLDATYHIDHSFPLEVKVPKGSFEVSSVDF